MTDRTYRIALAAIAAVVTTGAGLDIMEVDAAQYAGMARDMAERGDVLKLYFRRQDYLDKPPLLFWLSAISFKVFGIHDWSYRLPSIVFAFLGLYSTHRFAALYHDAVVARIATLMYGCSAAFFLMTNDVRCDTMLTGAVITSAWLGCAWLESGSRWYLTGFAIAMSAGMLAKGPIGAMAPMLAVGGQMVATRRWIRVCDPHLIMAAGIMALVLAPMCIGLYQQHGWHGIRFYFWEQSFGRITGENRWRNDSTILFFTHEILWQALPWTLYLMAGLWSAMRAVIARRALVEYASLAGAGLVLLALSLSRFKLPHYLFVALPFFAVIGANGYLQVAQRTARAQAGLLAVLWVMLFPVLMVFPDQRWPFLVLVVACGAASIHVWKRDHQHEGPFLSSLIVGLGAGLVMNLYFYPGLLAFQANARAGQWAARHGLSEDRFYGMQVSGTAMDLYAGYPVRWLSNAGEAAAVIRKGVTIYTDSVHRTELIDAGLVPGREEILLNFPAQRLNLFFLYPQTRERQLEKRYLLTY